MNFYKHYIGDFQRDTSHLTMTERGAYLALIQHYYATENCLPNDHALLCRIAGAMTKPERAAVKAVMPFFESKPEGLWHKRIEAELGKTDDKRDTNRQIALDREAKKRAAKLAQTEHETCTKRSTDLARSLHENSTIPEPKPDSRQKPYSVESEGVTDVSSSVVSITQSHPPIIDAFQMYLEWYPTEDFIRNLPGGMGPSALWWMEELLEFCTYWQSTGERFNQAKWEHTFLKNLEANKKYREANLI